MNRALRSILVVFGLFFFGSLTTACTNLPLEVVQQANQQPDAGNDDGNDDGDEEDGYANNN